ncbi:hypothetical protein TRVA0_002S04654 [Trichomonascus vanleenenianus]|uniref:uncharacterized protein n=1 Tax=Trichomonascus vanleenenianus TaxID=2268995 RepID=UPI003ECAE1E3
MPNGLYRTIMTIGESRFQVLKTHAAARTGLYSFSKSTIQSIATPGFVASTSRGVVPHLTPDNVARRSGDMAGFFVAAEDFLDKLPDIGSVPILHPECPGRSMLSLPEDRPLIVGPRRSCPVEVSQPNSDKTVSVFTSEGYKKMPLTVYGDFVAKLSPEIVLSPPDMPNLSPGGTPGTNRTRKMVIRSERWLLEALEKHGPTTDVFAPLLPGIPNSSQNDYLSEVAKVKDRISGLTFWPAETGRLSARQVAGRPGVEAARPKQVDPAETLLASHGLELLPKYVVVGCDTPQEILNYVSRGYDLFQGDCATKFTDAGIALDFTFPSPALASEDAVMFGRNLWDEEYCTDMSTLGSRVPNVTGTTSRAYVHHLLKAREMTAWVVLQMHNINVLSQFFAGVRESIVNGTFTQDYEAFVKMYGTTEDVLAFRDGHKTKSTGPTARGYAIGYKELTSRTGAGERLNDPPFQCL